MSKRQYGSINFIVCCQPCGQRVKHLLTYHFVLLHRHCLARRIHTKFGETSHLQSIASMFHAVQSRRSQPDEMHIGQRHETAGEGPGSRITHGETDFDRRQPVFQIDVYCCG